LFDEAVQLTAAVALLLPAAQRGTTGTHDAYNCAQDIDAADATADASQFKVSCHGRPASEPMQLSSCQRRTACAHPADGNQPCFGRLYSSRLAAASECPVAVPKHVMQDALCLSLGYQLAHMCARGPAVLFQAHAPHDECSLCLTLHVLLDDGCLLPAGFACTQARVQLCLA
jgi:hypothetical protein